jgi:transcriptional regulator with XRE-family HTH domain
MIFSGNQSRAARTLLGLDQEALAEKVGVSDNTIRNMEACGADPVGGCASTRDEMRKAWRS